MRPSLTVALFGLLLSIGLCTGKAEPGSTDEAAVKALIARYVSARNAMDPAAVRTLFTYDADQLVSTGEWRRGIDTLVSGSMAASRKETGKREITVESVRFLDRQVAIADGRYATSSASSGAIRRMWTTLVVKRTPDGWRIAAIRNMLPSAPSAPGR